MNCIIVDDEKKAREVLVQYVDRIDALSLLAEFRDPVKALNYVMEDANEVDLIFLDINMPGINGVEFVKSLANKPYIIFTTAYDEYALDGYEQEVSDYLLKPIRFDRFSKAVRKVLNHRQAFSQKSMSAEYDEHIMVKSGHSYHKLLLKDIVYLKKDSNYIEVHSKEDRPLLIRHNMNAIFDILPSEGFIRVHKSYVISKAFLKVIESGQVLLNTGVHIPIGTSYKENLMKEFPYLK